MLKAARNLLRRFGFISALLLLLASVVPAAAAEGCALGAAEMAAVSTVASVQTSDACVADGCQDCGLACTHGCCHAPHVGVMAAAEVAPVAASFKSPAAWADILGAPLRAPSGPERPPRA